MQQGLQVVLVGHRDGLVCRIHPLHRQLQRLPTPHRAHRRGGGEHFLGLDGRIGEEGVFGVGGEIGEVGHGGRLLSILQFPFRDFFQHTVSITTRNAKIHCSLN